MLFLFGQDIDHLLGHPEEPMFAQHHALQAVGGGQTQDRSVWMVWMVWLGCWASDLDGEW